MNMKSAVSQSADTSMFAHEVSKIILLGLRDLAWAAGFVDGEGCISTVMQTYQPDEDGKQRPPTMRFKLTVSQNCASTLKHLQKILGEKSYLNEVTFTQDMNRRAWVLHYDGKHALKAIKKLEPFLHRKKQFVHVAEKLFEEGKLGQRPGRKGWDAETLRARNKWATRLRRLQ